MMRFGIGLSSMVIAILNYEATDESLVRLACAAVIGVAGSLISQGIDHWIRMLARNA